MIFMGNRRAKEGKDAVASGLHDVAFVAMDRLHHELQGGIDEGAGFLGVEAFHQNHRAFDISKEGSDDFAFTVRGAAGFHSGLLGPDARSQMWRRITDWSSV